MQLPVFLVFATSVCGILFHSYAVGQSTEEITTISPLKIVDNEKSTLHLDDLVIEVTPPRGRQDNVDDARTIVDGFDATDDAEYWESIYGKFQDIPELDDDPPIIAGDTVELKYVTEWQNERSDEKPTEASDKEPSEISTLKNVNGDDREKTLTTKISRIARNSDRQSCEIIDHLFPMAESMIRRKRDNHKTDNEKTKDNFKTISKDKKKRRILLSLKNHLKKFRSKVNWLSKFLTMKNGGIDENDVRSLNNERESSSVEDLTWIHDDVGMSEEFVDSEIGTVESVKSTISKMNDVVERLIPNAAGRVGQVKRQVIDSGPQGPPGVVSGGPANRPNNEVSLAVATNIDDGLKVVGNSVLDTNSGIINADKCVIDGNATYVDAERNVETRTELKNFVDKNDSSRVDQRPVSDALTKSTSKPGADETSIKNIATTKIQRKMSSHKAEVEDEILATEDSVGDATKVRISDLKRASATSGHVKNVDEMMKNVETSVGSALEMTMESKVDDESLDEAKVRQSTSSKRVISPQKSFLYDHARRVLGIQGPTYQRIPIPEKYHDREFYYANQDRYRPRNQDYNGRQSSAINSRNSDFYDTNRHAGTELTINGEIQRDTGHDESMSFGKNRLGHDYSNKLDNLESGNSNDNTESFPTLSRNPFYRDHPNLCYPRLDAKTLIRQLPVAGTDTKKRLREAGKSYRSLVDSLYAGTDCNSNVKDNYFDPVSGTSVNGDYLRAVVGHARSKRSDEIIDRSHEPDEKIGEDISVGYPENDDQRDYGRCPANRYINLYRDAESALHGVSSVDVKSMNVHSHLDVGEKTNEDSVDDRRSGSPGELNVGQETGELGQKDCEPVYQGYLDFLRLGGYSNEKLQRRPVIGDTDDSCPNSGGQDNVFDDGLSYSSNETTCELDDLRKNDERVDDPTECVETQSKHAHGDDRLVNLDANSSNETKEIRTNPDRCDSDHKMRTRRDEKSVDVGIAPADLSHGHDIVLDTHDRARTLIVDGSPSWPGTASVSRLCNEKMSDDRAEPNGESESTMRGTKLSGHELSIDCNTTPNDFLEFRNHRGIRITDHRICRGDRERSCRYNNYRSLDGRCNNVVHPNWGRSNTSFARILPARYSDGVHEMPLSVTGAELPNPRDLSVALYSRESKIDPELTLAVVQWGQTVAHDLGHQIVDRTARGDIACCPNDGKYLPEISQHRSCAPITITPNDKFYSRYGQRCMNFVRTMTVPKKDCSIGPSDQVNGVTSFLDCSFMYGSDKTTSNELREFTGGRMKIEFRNGRWMLPTARKRSLFCHISTSDDVCYKTGDPRNNQNPQLAILQTLLVREHNRVADELSTLNKKWNDERIFQEARRIVIAEYQHITYNEWLPLILGRRYAEASGVIRARTGMSDVYDEGVNPSTIIGFTSGAFRSLHSMIEGDIGLWNFEGNLTDNLKMSDHYSRPKVIEEYGNFENLLLGLVAQRVQMQDMNMHPEVTEYLFRSNKNYGMDLAAIDIQRGRDHGLPGYNAYRKICRLETANKFDDLAGHISSENIEKLRRNYAHVDDIDLIVGAMMEHRAPGSRFGPTNRCLIGEQFYRSRLGDRYFYDNANFRHSFTPEQFHEITKVTMSRFLCDVSGAIIAIQRNAFRAKTLKNPLVSCKNLPKMNLEPWRER